jgi:hypothetical protein
MPPERLQNRVLKLVRELNLLVCGASLEDLKHIIADLAATQGFATARLREERLARTTAQGEPPPTP